VVYWDPAAQRVLVLEKRIKPGLWRASFPEARRQTGETAVQAAVRALADGVAVSSDTAEAAAGLAPPREVEVGGMPYVIFSCAGLWAGADKRGAWLRQRLTLTRQGGDRDAWPVRQAAILTRASAQGRKQVRVGASSAPGAAAMPLGELDLAALQLLPAGKPPQTEPPAGCRWCHPGEGCRLRCDDELQVSGTEGRRGGDRGGQESSGLRRAAKLIQRVEQARVRRRRQNAARLLSWTAWRRRRGVYAPLQRPIPRCRWGTRLAADAEFDEQRQKAVKVLDF